MKRKQNKSKSKKRPDIIFANVVIGGLIIFVIVILLWGFGLVIYRDTGGPTAKDREQVKTQLLDAVKPIQMPDELAYELAEDRGCIRAGGGYAGYSISCTYKAYKYFKSDANLTEDLESVTSLLVKEGWETSQYSDYGFRRGDIALALNSYPENEKADTISENFLAENGIELNDNRYIYGVSLSSKYWGCSYALADFWKYPCPEVKVQ